MLRHGSVQAGSNASSRETAIIVAKKGDVLYRGRRDVARAGWIGISGDSVTRGIYIGRRGWPTCRQENSTFVASHVGD